MPVHITQVLHPAETLKRAQMRSHAMSNGLHKLQHKSQILAIEACFLALTISMTAQSVPPALESPAANPPQIGSHGERLLGMPKFHEPAPYDIDEHTGFTQLFDGKSMSGWEADPSIWRIEDGIMVGETFEGEPKGNNYI